MRFLQYFLISYKINLKNLFSYKSIYSTILSIYKLQYLNKKRLLVVLLIHQLQFYFILELMISKILFKFSSLLAVTNQLFSSFVTQPASFASNIPG